MFTYASPIWLDGLQAKMNIQARFSAEFTLDNIKDVVLYITGAALYKVFVNDQFAGYGPARAPHGYARVDEIDLQPFVKEGRNDLRIEVSGSFCYSFYTIRQPSFLCAEVRHKEQVICYTGRDFTGAWLRSRLQKVMRYSFQRTFSEVWDDRISPLALPVVSLALPLRYLPRGVVTPDYSMAYSTLCAAGTFTINEAAPLSRPRYVNGISTIFSGFSENELEATPYFTWQQMNYQPGTASEGNGPYRICSGEYLLLDMGRNYTGFLQARLRVIKDARIFISFDEKLDNGIINPHRIDMINLLDYHLTHKDGFVELESFEVYGWRYMQVMVLEGEIELESTGVRQYIYPVPEQELGSEDPLANEIYAAAVETFRQNTLDVFMDCPTRERAGWLCDSFFTARSEYCYTGKSQVERVFMENYRLYDGGTNVPKGMLPMCYPADHMDGVFIPQWAMWYIMELEEFLQRCPDVAPENYRQLCYDLLSYLKQFANKDGLLENLPSWNFVEWSQANSWTNDVNYPTNMIYARVLEIIGTIYNDLTLIKQSRDIRERIVELSFDGRLFADHAVRDENNRLVNQPHFSEVCQYYAVFFGLVDLEDEKYKAFKNMVLDGFSPLGERDPRIEPANAFMGMYLRMDILLAQGRYKQLLEEIKQFFGGMARHTGTLWEHKNDAASLNHGFASYAGVVLRKIMEKLV